MVKKDQLQAIALIKSFEGFPENGCHGNQPQPLEVLFHSIDFKNSCFFTKQDVIFKQA